MVTGTYDRGDLQACKVGAGTHVQGSALGSGDGVCLGCEILRNTVQIDSLESIVGTVERAAEEGDAVAGFDLKVEIGRDPWDFAGAGSCCRCGHAEGQDERRIHHDVLTEGLRRSRRERLE